MFKPVFAALVAALCAVAFIACSTAPKSESDKAELHADVEQAVAIFRSKPALDKFFNSAYGYAVFPSVGKGGLIVGGAYGKGEVFEQGKFVGNCDLSQGTVGLQLGGQAFREIIFFQFKETLDQFKQNTFEFAANASAVAVEAAAATTADYDKGVAVFVMGIGGLMAEAAIGGQNLRFVPVY
jgi:lipid-binding SYLF domain-containing protein